MNNEPSWVVKKVEAEDDYVLRLVFADGSERLFDFKPYLAEAIYEPLKNIDRFSEVHVSGDSVAWSNGIDIAPEELYEKSIEV